MSVQGPRWENERLWAGPTLRMENRSATPKAGQTAQAAWSEKQAMKEESYENKRSWPVAPESDTLQLKDFRSCSHFLRELLFWNNRFIKERMEMMP